MLLVDLKFLLTGIESDDNISTAFPSNIPFPLLVEPKKAPLLGSTRGPISGVADDVVIVVSVIMSVCRSVCSVVFDISR